MKPLILSAIVASLMCGSAYADWDPALEAREAAKRKAEQQESARKQAEAGRMRDAANQKAMRGMLGKEAEGKTDAEVAKLYQQRMAGYQKQAAAASASAPGVAAQMKKADAETRPQRDAQMKSMTGKSVSELEKMSDKELENFARDMEKKFGSK